MKFAWSRGSRAKLSRNKVEHYDRIGRDWSRERVVDELQKRAAAGLPLHKEALVKEGNYDLAGAAWRCFGSWEAAAVAAGIEGRFKVGRWWTPDRVVRAIRDRYGAGRPVYAKAMYREACGLYQAGIRHFGTWSVALTAAGVPDSDQKALPRRWTKDAVLQALRRRAAEGLPTTYGAVRQDDRRLASIVYYYFGRWEKGLRAAGVDGLESSVRPETGAFRRTSPAPAHFRPAPRIRAGP